MKISTRKFTSSKDVAKVAILIQSLTSLDLFHTALAMTFATMVSDSDHLSDHIGEYTCKICGHIFLTAQSLAAHIDPEHPDAEQPEIF